MIIFKNVTKKYDNKIALNNVSFNIMNGEFVFLTGQSGAGKSTIIKLLLREFKTDSGDVEVNDDILNDLKNDEICLYRRKLGVVFQDYKLLPKKNIYDNISFALQVIETPNSEIDNLVRKALSIVNLSDKAMNYPHELSGGEQQRVAIARAIVNKPSIIVADEPTGNLDPETSMDIVNLFLNINEKYDTTIIMATHNKEIVDKLCKHVITIDDGVIVKNKDNSTFY